MKKTAWVLAAVCLTHASTLFSASAAAQSDKPAFIDSPAYVLQNGRHDLPAATTATTAATAATSTAAANVTTTATPVTATATAAPSPAPVTAQPQPRTQTQAQQQPQAQAARPDKAAKPAKPKADKPKSPLARQGKLVYVSFDVAPVVNWYANIDRPFDRKGCRVIVNPTLSVDFDLGYYMFLGTGLSFNTTGGRLQFPSEYVNRYQALGFSAYSQVLRAYTASYVEIPVVFRVQSNPMQGWRVFGSVGGHFGIRVLAKYKDTYDDFIFQNPQKPAESLDGQLIRTGKFNKNINLWQVALGLKFGASYQLIDQLALRFGVGYRYGFLDALTKSHERPLDERQQAVRPHVKPQQFEIFVGITF